MNLLTKVLMRSAKPVDKEPPKSREMSKKTQTRSSAKKEAVYAVAKKNAKELATSGVNTLKETQERLLEMFDQELQFQKLEKDCRQPLVTHEEIFSNLQEAYTPLCEEMLRKRQEKIADVSRMLKNNKPARQEALKDMSKKARHQLEQAKLREKEATDAAELIKRIKILLRN
ncbi:hypothetical protein CPB84DRAFT_745602 [Gymnopilus junonius]|uniref:Uncharacterized protein n=1 Tax=Gymnopilus junonius TaxID=109634 RepID=A0A9P5NZY6_GYMJU|nr:hypothetical protein CPB84DRAFT_745602 [Gymnopilus junonius]